MRVFSKILVPVDLSDRSKSAIQMALDLADSENGRVRLLHVIETIEGIDDGEFDSFYDDLGAKAGVKLASWVEEFDAQAGRMETAITYGHRARQIVEQADERGCDLVVLSSHRIDRERPAGGLGTISHQVALVCNCPVLLIR